MAKRIVGEDEDDVDIDEGGSDTQPMSTNELIAAIRGGVPERCDFCGGPIPDPRRAVAEEGGLWACLACWARF